MCEQTEIHYLDGDVVWVKLGACWWPGEVKSFENLPEDIQAEFKKKPLIAAVKFFQEDTYEFVKNLQQIYKYNCTQKDEFIKKGLDKYRTKSKDGTSYMDKFPEDVETAEKLTGGDPRILTSDRFGPEEKPDISALFGEKKIPKRKRERDESGRRSEGGGSARKITHPRFLKESDHEIRIRQQPSSLPNTPQMLTGSPEFSCHLCSFTSSRVNVIICHRKSHQSGTIESPSVRPRILHRAIPKSSARPAASDTQKRKYVRKTKSLGARSKIESEAIKRKSGKQIEKTTTTKKKKTDPELKEQLLADWNDESDENVEFDLNKSNSIGSPDGKNSEETNDRSASIADAEDGNEILEASEKLLRETEKIAAIAGDDMPSRASRNSNHKFVEDFDFETEASVTGKSPGEKSPLLKKQKTKNSAERLSATADNDAKSSSRFSCFDFDEDDLPEPSITPVRKIPRVFGEKNTSVKKEILKKFTMSQALIQEKEDEVDNEKTSNNFFPVTGASTRRDNDEVVERPKSEILVGENENSAKVASEIDDKIEEESPEEILESEKDSKSNSVTTELEIVEILEVEGEKVTDSLQVKKEGIKDESPTETVETIETIEKPEMKDESSTETVETIETIETVEMLEDEVVERIGAEDAATKIEEKLPKDAAVEMKKEIRPDKPVDEAMSEAATTETEDETVSELADSVQGHSEASDTDGTPNLSNWGAASSVKIDEKPAPRRRGRPRKNAIPAVDASGNGDDSSKREIAAKQIEAPVGRDSERKTSESDSDRSFTGRRRKPNKRYLHSELLTRSPDNRASKTDESQSETEEKLPKETKSKTRRGRKSSVLATSRTSRRTKDEEFEFSNKTLDAAEIAHQDVASPTASSRIEKFGDEPTTSRDNIPGAASTDTEGDSGVLRILDIGKKSDSGIGSPVNITKLLSSGDSETSPSRDRQSIDKKSILSNDRRAIPEEVVALTAAETNSASDETAGDPKFDALKTPVEKLPPKKSQIKKFELSQVDLLDACSEQVAAEAEAARLKHFSGDADMDGGATGVEEVPYPSPKRVVREEGIPDATGKDNSTPSDVIIEAETPRPINEEAAINQRDEKLESASLNFERNDADKKSATNLVKIEDVVPMKDIEISGDIETPENSSRHPEESKEDKSSQQILAERSQEKKVDENAVNSFQEAFLKTLHPDIRDEANNKAGETTVPQVPISSSEENVVSEPPKVPAVAGNDEMVKITTPPHQDTRQVATTLNAMTEFEGIEILVQDNIVEAESKLTEPTSQVDLVSGLVGGDIKDDATDTLSLELRKIEDTLTDATASTPSPSSDVGVPVKKREKPRIIENVTLKEPMQILKSKLLEKLPTKTAKHKLESEAARRGETKGAPRAKIMKIDAASLNSVKSRSPAKTSLGNLTIGKKLQALKDEAKNTTVEMEKSGDRIIASQTIAVPAGGEKFIQQSSQSLADMELDINSMSFVLSEDVLTPESIEQMPVVISSIVASTTASTSTPSSCSGAPLTTLALAPATKLTMANQAQFKSTSETATTETTTTTTTSSSGKKKTGPPAILKNKGKAKPTITSIKTLVPPLTGGVKGLKFQSPPGGKAMPLMSQKSAPGKYVIVQTGGQQMRYSVKPGGAQQKIVMPAGKTAASPQIVQQGGKVVILTSPKSGQTKMLPLNIAKSMTGKVQKIVNNKGQIYTSMSGGQGIAKTIIAPRGDAALATTSKLPQGQKVINTQGIMSPKGVLTPITTTKCSLLSALPQTMLTKGGMYTPISTAQLTGKTLIGGKGLAAKTSTILTALNPQVLTTSKGAVLAPHTLTAKTIMNAQGLVATKGTTVFTPITGQKVKEIAAKSPAKGVSKVHYQPVQQKLQLPMFPKKVPISPNSQVRIGASVKSPSGVGTIVLQNAAATGQKVTTISGGKKIVRQIVHSGARSPQVAQATVVPSLQTVMPRGKALTTTTTTTAAAGTPTMQRVAVPRGRQTKGQQKIVVQKLQESNSPVVQAPLRPTTSAGVVGNAAKTPQKSPAHRGSARVNKHAQQQQQQKNLLNVALSSIATNESPHPTLAPPPLAPLAPLAPHVPGSEVAAVLEAGDAETERVVVETPKHEIPGGESVETLKIEETSLQECKTPAQPQIMALPAESSDGTQTYVLATIDDQGQIVLLDNNTLMSLEGTTQNPDGSRMLYIDPGSLGEAGPLDNVVLQFDNGTLPSLSTNAGETSQTIASTETFATTEIMQTSNQDILAAALANTDFQQEIGLPENPGSSGVVTTGLTATSLINQTILQSTIIPPTEPISSPSVLETSLTLNQPIMTPLEVPSSLPIRGNKSTPASIVATIPTSLELPGALSSPSISYIATTASTANCVVSGEQIQIAGNSMPDLAEIMKSPARCEIAPTDASASTRYLVIPRLNESATIMQARGVESAEDSVPGGVSYSVSIPDSAIGDNAHVQTTPSMPIIDDAFAEATEETFANDAQTSSDSSAVVRTSPERVQSAPEESAASPTESQTCTEAIVPVEQIRTGLNAVEDAITQAQRTSSSADKPQTPLFSEIMGVVDEQNVEAITTSGAQVADETRGVTPETNTAQVESSKSVATEAANSSETIQASTLSASEVEDKPLDSLTSTRVSGHEMPASFMEQEPTETPSLGATTSHDSNDKVPFAESVNNSAPECIVVEESAETALYRQRPEDPERLPGTSSSPAASNDNADARIEDPVAGTSQEEAPSQSYEQFDASRVTSDSTEIPTQSAEKTENSREPSQSIAYEAMEVDENVVAGEPPTQSFEDSTSNEATQSYETASANAPTQSFNEMMQCQEDTAPDDADGADDPSFPTQSYEVGKIENSSDDLEGDAAVSQEGNIPSQSNDVGNDGIGTSSTITINNSGLNEDETASSSYVPETPENQERDQDQESAISTSSYEIPPCEELNIASSSVIPDTSVGGGEHTSIHDNGVPEIPTSSYSLNPDSSSTSQVDALPTSSYEDRVVVEQNVSTSNEVPISMPGLEENSAQNFVTESTDHRNEPSSYYTRHPEVSASYYEAVPQDSDSRLETDHQEEVTPSYYETPQDAGESEASQSYFRTTPRYSNQGASPSYYDPAPESEASQSYYSHEIEATEQSSRNVEASQSFYQETSDEIRLRQQGEATPTYTERYPVDYALANSPIERHDLVESSVPATRPTER